MTFTANWIAPKEDMGSVCPEFVKRFELSEKPLRAVLRITGMGVYEAGLNGSRVGNFVMAPGWTAYKYRHQYQEYDVTELLAESNLLTVLLGKGWYRGPWRAIDKTLPAGLIGELILEYPSGRTELIPTDESWTVRESKVRFSELYNGETADGGFAPEAELPVKFIDFTKDNLIPQEGEIVCEQERVSAKRLFTTPAGETVVDFGQEITGYVEFTVRGAAGDTVEISHAEVLDRHGNFYTENYRSAK
ncbi:MAG: family 78 glycoside hydrolase catalytic domain, partial [Clostridia bacterium]|nr:family 78 glycoside hydrolase catalytic domain [Clostridia bacterium]